MSGPMSAQAPTEDAAPKSVSVGKAGSIMAGALLLSRLLGLLRDTVMAYKFGISLESDAYRLAVTIPDTLFMLIAGGGLSSAFIPVFSEYYYTQREKQAWKLFSVLVSVFAVLVAVLIAVAWIFAPQIAAYMAAGKPTEDPARFVASVTYIGRVLLPAQFAFLVGSLLLGTLYARKQFIAPALAPNLYNVGIILGALIVSSAFGIGITGMAWGALAGATIGSLIVPLFFMAKLGSQFTPSFDLKTEGVSKFFKLFAPVVFGFSLPSMTGIIMTKFGASYGENSNSILASANNLMQAPNGIFGQSLAMAILPVLSQLVATKQMDQYRAQISATLRTVLYLSIPAAVLMGVLSLEITQLLYGYGRAARTPESLATIGNMLTIFSIGIVAWCVQPILMRGFFSLHKTFKPVALSTCLTGLYILGLQFVPKSLGLQAIPWVTNICVWLLAFVLFISLEQEVGHLERKSIFLTAGKSFAACVPLALVALGGHMVMGHQGRLVSLLLVLFTSLLSAWAYFFASRALKMPESAYLEKAMARFGVGR